ncbi:hypothetical protein OKW29_006470 [Paraburkholderia sp. CI3]
MRERVRDHEKEGSVFPKLHFRYFCFFLDASSPYS